MGLCLYINSQNEFLTLEYQKLLKNLTFIFIYQVFSTSWLKHQTFTGHKKIHKNTNMLDFWSCFKVHGPKTRLFKNWTSQQTPKSRPFQNWNSPPESRSVQYSDPAVDWVQFTNYFYFFDNIWFASGLLSQLFHKVLVQFIFVYCVLKIMH